MVSSALGKQAGEGESGRTGQRCELTRASQRGLEKADALSRRVKSLVRGGSEGEERMARRALSPLAESRGLAAAP